MLKGTLFLRIKLKFCLTNAIVQYQIELKTKWGLKYAKHKQIGLEKDSNL